jgi:osmotically-inducible protein OsmY
MTSIAPDFTQLELDHSPHPPAGAPVPDGPADLLAGIRVTSSDGVVRLEGEASSVEAWQHIRDAALAAPGVRAVADEIRVRGARPLRATDRTEQLARSIADVPGMAGSVAVEVDAGVVTLWGQVPNARIRERVIEAVRDVVGGAWIQMRIVTG